MEFWIIRVGHVTAPAAYEPPVQMPYHRAKFIEVYAIRTTNCSGFHSLAAELPLIDVAPEQPCSLACLPADGVENKCDEYTFMLNRSFHFMSVLKQPAK